MLKKRPTCVLTIAGSDSGGGAGVQADARTIHALGGFACTAITAITAQNTRGVISWCAVSPKMIEGQIDAVLDDLPIRAIKTGLLPGAAAVRAVARAIKRRPGISLVVDPVIGSTSGTRFLDSVGLRALRRELLPLATLVTPNWPEAEALVGERIATFADAERVVRNLSESFGCAVLLKGGHGPSSACRDYLATTDGKARRFESPRLSTRNAHGTGCVLSAAIATELARGKSIIAAVSVARRFLQRALRRGQATYWRGAGPAYFR
jgi:hydroxymethylpyrimidine/phosphomethylpyrimidine kinase